MNAPHLPPSHHQMHYQQALPGMMLAIAAFALFTGADTFFKLVGAGGYGMAQLMFTVGCFGLVPILLMAAMTGGAARLKTKKLRWHILRGFVGAGGFYFGILAVTHMPLVNFYTIMFAGPLLITALSALWLREHVGWRRWLAVVIGFIGVLIMLRPFGLIDPSQKGLGLGEIAALCAVVVQAFSVLLVRRMGHGESNLTFTFYSTLCNLSVTGPISFAAGFMIYTPQEFVMIATAGLLAGIAGICLMTAYQRTPAALIAPFQYTQLVWGALLGYLIWAYLPDGWTVLGAAIVIGSGLFIIRREIGLRRAYIRQI